MMRPTCSLLARRGFRLCKSQYSKGFLQAGLCQAAAIYYFPAILPLASNATISHALGYPRSHATLSTSAASSNYIYPESRSSSRALFSTFAGDNYDQPPTAEVLSALQNLSARLEEWEPNLSELSESSATAMSTDAVSSQDHDTDTNSQMASLPVLSIDEYARIFCTGYIKLPPLKLGWIATALSPSDGKPMINYKTNDWSCPRSAVLLFLAKDCGTSNMTVSSPALSKFLDQVQRDLPNDNNDNNSPVLEKLRQLWTPKFENILQCLLEHNSQETLAMVVKLRGDLLRLLTVLPRRKDDATVQTIRDSLMQLEGYLRKLLSAWFSPGMLQIRRITYNTTSAGIIEKIAVKEAVHPMRSLDDLRRRLGPQRRVFGLFHPLLPDEPLVILHVHLETSTSNDHSHIPATMSHVMRKSDDTELDSQPRVATFYSISNTQHGLTRGLGLGEFLIKGAVRELQKEFPLTGSLETFVTLSPMPAFRNWVDDVVVNTQKQAELPPSLMKKVTTDRSLLEQLLEDTESRSSISEVNILPGSGSTESLKEQLEGVRPTLMHLAAHYVLEAKNKRSGKPFDPVTGFHVHNGAEVFRINYAADLSPKGLLRSFGVMVNYRYQLDQVESNKARFESSHFQDIPTTSIVREILDTY